MTNRSRKLARLARSTVLMLCTASAPVLQAADQAIEAAAVDRLKASMDYVSVQKAFSLTTTSTIEVVLDSGQKLQFENAIRVTVQRPDKFHARRVGDLVNQEFFYDGDTLTLQDSTAGFHATVAAPDTIESMLDFARDSLDIVAPAGDFIYSNAFEILMEGVESAMHLGPSYIEGEICDHLAFSAPGHGTDWQIWIQQGDKPLPRRIVITSRDVLNAPQFAVHIQDWELAPDIPKGLFKFDAQDAGSEIEFIPVNTGNNQ